MRIAVSVISLFLSIFLFLSIATPDPLVAQGNEAKGTAGNVDQEDFALCTTGPSLPVEHVFPRGYLQVFRQVFSVPTLTASTGFYRRPPPFSLLP